MSISDADLDRIAQRVADVLEARAEERRVAEAKAHCTGCATGMPLYADARGVLMHLATATLHGTGTGFACTSPGIQEGMP